MIDKTSRYARTGTFVGEDASGERVETLELRAVTSSPAAFIHTPVEGERLDHLAYQYFRDARQFWRICDLSDELDPFDVVVSGKSLGIPPLR
jgi:hypothetical protein